MQDLDLNLLRAYALVAREKSFTRAAAQLGLSPSALSHAMRRLEARLDTRLLARTTRGVATTEAGERLLADIAPHLEGIADGLTALTDARDRPAGNFRITTHDHAFETVLWPRLARFLPRYPDIRVEINIDYRLVDIVAERFDAGVRAGDLLARDMIAVRIGPDLRMAVVGSPAYFADHPAPRAPSDLARHVCINLRLNTRGGLYAWEFARGGKTLAVHVQGPCAFNTTPPMLQAALAGLGLAYVPEDMALPHLKAGRLRQVLAAWCPAWPGYHLYFPNRRLASPAFGLLVDALRYRP